MGSGTVDFCKADADIGVPGWFTPARINGCIWAFVLLGAIARITRYLLRFPLWEDEAFLAYNLMNRGFLELLSPLDFNQVAPVGYLWMQRAVIETLGFSEWSLRLPALVAGIAGLLVFRRVAQFTLPPFAQLFAVATFAVAYPLVRYSAEAKQYGFDLFFSVVLLWMLLEWRAQPARYGWLAGLALVTPLALFLSHAVAFVAGGVSLALAWELWRQPSRRGWLAWGAANALVGAAFFAHWLLLQNIVTASVAEFMNAHWHENFPPLGNPLELFPWLLTTHACEFMAFPLGSANGGSALTLIGVLVGFMLWVRQRRLNLVIVALVPLALHFLAAAMQRYPYGGHVKFTVYWIPMGSLLLGTSLAYGCAWLDRRRAGVPTGSLVSLTIFALIAGGVMARDFYCPAKTRSDQRARDFARWFWFDADHDSVTICLHADLHQQFTPEATTRLNWFASYACNCRIYSPRQARHQAPDWQRVSAAQPLLCLEYRAAWLTYDNAAQKRWLEEMKEKYELLGLDRYPVTRYNARDRSLVCVDHIQVYKFGPRSMARAVTRK
ncbi:MAG: glycosyltransferase family 39 protein [Planctomycetes bacterium]|nr:glycosyltransferase family 39 protein [Planctomycetota bacterium]